MVRKRVVEFRVEHFHQRRRRIAAEISGHLVHFVQHEDRVHRAGLLHHLDDLAGQGADIGAAMAANLGFIAHAAERHADELAASRMADGHGQRSLAHSWSPTKHRIEPFDSSRVGDRQKLKDPFLDLIEAIVLFVQDFSAALMSRISFDFFSTVPPAANRGSCG